MDPALLQSLAVLAAGFALSIAVQHVLRGVWSSEEELSRVPEPVLRAVGAGVLSAAATGFVLGSVENMVFFGAAAAASTYLGLNMGTALAIAAAAWCLLHDNAPRLLAVAPLAAAFWYVWQTPYWYLAPLAHGLYDALALAALAA